MMTNGELLTLYVVSLSVGTVGLLCGPGVPGRIRTRDPLLRRQPLCPAELQGRLGATVSV